MNNKTQTFRLVVLEKMKREHLARTLVLSMGFPRFSSAVSDKDWQTQSVCWKVPLL